MAEEVKMRRVWVVDDKIPVHRLYAGPQPGRHDAELVRHLVSEHKDDWEESEVRNLCEALCAGDYSALFFISPEQMLRAIEDGIVPPHAVVFDWEYGKSDDARSLGALQKLLERTFTFVQVYTHLGSAAVEPKLGDLRAAFRERVLPARTKADTTATDLAAHVAGAWKGTIAGAIADRVRSATDVAVERALIEMCSVPRLTLAGIGDGKVDNVVSIVLSKVREELGADAIQALEEILKGGGKGESTDALRRLLSVWYYSFPNDDRVRRGDIIEVDCGLGLVVTPACDLAEFPKKTGRRLTWLRMTALDADGVKALNEAGLKVDEMAKSITGAHGGANDGIVLLPNVPAQAGNRATLTDQLVVCHAWESRTLTLPAGTKEPLRYTADLGVVRRCTVAEPFASAVIARAVSVITSPATPNMSDSERDRVNALIPEAFRKKK